ncbi:MAG: S-layer family protein [Moorea sp. SIO2B7]|nr:S-layer family protein [Moorena sp. SIO2B7]
MKLKIISRKGKLATETTGIGDAGNININTQKLTLTDGVEISASTRNSGNAGDININADYLNLTNGATVQTNTFGTGKAGGINLNISNQVNLVGSSLETKTEGVGIAGGVNINTPQLTLNDDAKIYASSIGSLGGNIKLDNLEILQVNNSNISASTVDGKAGSIEVNASESVQLTGEGGLNVAGIGKGKAGSINVNTTELTIQDGAKISAENTDGEGGSINVNTNTFITSNGGQVVTTTSGSADAGNINLNILDKDSDSSILLEGNNSGIFANTATGSTGKGGDIIIDPTTMIIKDGAGVAASSQGSGEGGNIDIEIGNLTLDNQAFISTETATNQGGNITLNIQDKFFLRNNSQITATAGTEDAGGDGGNITINAPFIVAVPSENSDITANAFEGKGGNINITTEAILGIKFREKQTELSDITASSEFGISGTVTINNPNVDPASGLLELKSQPVDAAALIAQNVCKVENDRIAGGSSFIITGKGGLPAAPIDLINNNPGIVEWATREELNQEQSPVILHQRKTPLREIRQAQGWVVAPDGTVILTAETVTVTPQNPGLNHPGCNDASR